MSHPSIEDYRWLTGCEAQGYLSLAAQADSELVALASRLRRELSAVRAHLVLELAALRRRGRQKFSQSDRMFFTRKLLEQATDEWIAAYKAGRMARAGQLVDLCCGLGGDLLELSAQAACTAVDRDPIAALLARTNCESVHGRRIAVAVADVGVEQVRGCSAWHVDPDRRAAGPRTSQLTGCEPPPDVIERLLAAQPAGAIKLAAAAGVPDHWRDGAEREWIGSGRECRQQVAWFGPLASQPGARRATLVDRHGRASSIWGAGDQLPPVTEQVRRYLIDPHAVVWAANLAGVLCARHGLEAVGTPAGYLTADVAPQDPLVSVFEVLEALPLDVRRLRAVVAACHGGRSEVKVRGVRVDPVRLSEKLKPSGDQPLVLLVFGSDGAHKVAVTRRLSPHADKV